MKTLLSPIRWLLVLAAVVLVLASFAPLLRSDVWWVRMTDFPRLQYLLALVAVGALLAVLPRAKRRGPGRGGWRRSAWGALVLAMLGAGAYDAWTLAPYFTGRPGPDRACRDDDGFSVMVANVQLGNRQADRLSRIVRDAKPDILLALETDEWWHRQLTSLTDEMPYTEKRLTGSYFGIHLLSRLPLARSETVLPVEQDAPAISAVVRLASGREVRFLGLHPRPPHPGQSSVGRDAQLVWAARQAVAAEMPVVVAGDFNWVPWETTLELMQRVGQLVDPRQLYGYVASFDAKSRLMRWPLDQILHGPGLDVLSFERLPAFGSDHFPILARLCVREGQQTPPPLRDGDLERADAIVAAALRGPREEVGDED